MSEYKGYLSGSFKAGKDLSDYQYCILTDVDGSKNYVQFAATSTEWAVGLLQDDPDSSGEAATVAYAGIAPCKLGDQVTSGSLIVANASGFGVSMASTGSIPVGRATIAGSTGDVIPVLINANVVSGGESPSNK